MAKTYAQLIPSIDRRLSTWVSIVEKIKSEEKMPPRPTVTISRRYGCPGFPLAETLKQIFEDKSGEQWNIYEKTLLEKVSQDEQLSLTRLQQLGGPSRILDILPITSHGRLSQQHFYRIVAQHIYKIAELGSAIIVGRGAEVITQPLKNCYRFRLEGSFDFRAASIAKRLEMPLDEAKKHVKEKQDLRDKFFRDCLNVSFDDHSFYDAIYNCERHSVDEIAWSIFAYVARGQLGKEAFKDLRFRTK